MPKQRNQIGPISTNASYQLSSVVLGGGGSVAAGPGHLSVTEFAMNISEVFQFQNMVIWLKKCQCWSRQQEPMTFPDSHSFSSTTRGAGASPVPLGRLNSLCGPIVLSTPISEDVHTFLSINLGWKWDKTRLRLSSNPHINRQQLWGRTTMKTGVATLLNADAKHVIRASYRQQRYAGIPL